MNKLRVKKHDEILSIDNFFVIDGALIIDKNYILLDDLLLDSILREKTLARYSDNKIIDLDEKPCNWSAILPSKPYEDDLPMFDTELHLEFNKTLYKLFKCDSKERLELQGINKLWFENYLPKNNLYYSVTHNQFTIWNNDKLIALIMPCYLKDSFFIKQLVNEINYFRSKYEMQQ
jgi:hypothetical protein